MEVHAHTHTSRKKWTHYFWEFLMLFLAVTLGFFVENQREHYIERHRAAILAQSLVEDLKKDTILLNATVTSCIQKINDLQELVKLLRQPAATRDDTLIYRKALLIQYATRFLRTAGTYNQIVNSGALRYFDQTLVNLMNQYDTDIRMVESRRDADLEIIFNTSLAFINRNFNQEVFDEILQNKPIKSTAYNKFQSHDLLNELVNHAIVSRRITERMKIESETALGSGRELIVALDKKYGLK
jgi:hypothetical protein